MKNSMFVLVLVGILVVFGAGPQASAELINFDDQGLTGPSTFGAAGPAQHLDIATGIGNVQFDGGVILENTTFLPANPTALYGTAFFGDPTLANPLVITFPSNISNFFLDVFNGLTSDTDYEVRDNTGNSAVFTLAPNLTGGTTQIGFAAVGDKVFIEGLPKGTATWDFFVDNIHFNEPLPPDLTKIPEPGSLILLGSGLAGLGLWGRRKFKARG